MCELVVHVDRSLGVEMLIDLPAGATVADAKRWIAEADPTGQTDPSSFGLRLPSSGDALPDAAPLPTGASELELCQPAAPGDGSADATNEQASERGAAPPGPRRKRQVRVGSAVAPVRRPQDATRVPRCPAARGVPLPARGKAFAKVMQWMLQKSSLRQDMFLLGAAGPTLRHIVAAYCSLLGKELEYVAITRDTSEADLKQRREIVDGRLIYVDQAPVRAARHGRVLLLEGIEKAERNVLPALNNLLENREMALEDQTFLVAPHRKAALAEAGNPGLIAVSEDFEVVAIGNPARGNPLDPPLRSRFACLEVRPWDLLGDTGAALSGPWRRAPEPGHAAALEALARELASAAAAAESAQAAGRLPPLPDGVPGGLLRLLALLPGASAAEFLRRAYPMDMLGLKQEQLSVAERAVKACGLLGAKQQAAHYAAVGLAPVPPGTAAEQGPQCVLVFQRQGRPEQEARARVPCGDLCPSWRSKSAGSTAARMVAFLEAVVGKLQFFSEDQLREWLADNSVDCKDCDDRQSLLARATEKLAERLEAYKDGAFAKAVPIAPELNKLHLTQSQRRTLSCMLQDHAVGVDVCIVGERGVGKSALVRAFCAVLGYRHHTVFCYQDMLARELLQRRATDDRGNTLWKNGPLLDAALSGGAAVLDGVHRLAGGVLYSAVGRLLQDREADLADGRRLVSPEHFAELLAAGHSAEELAKRGVLQVHPAFRVLATGEPSVQSGGKQGGKGFWLSEETQTLFHFHQVRPLPLQEQVELCRAGPSPQQQRGADMEVVRAAFEGLARFGASIQEQAESDPSLKSLALSLRQLLRVGRHLCAWPQDMAGAVDRALSARLRFLPTQTQEAVDKLLSSTLSNAGASGMRSLLRPAEERYPGEQDELQALQEKRAEHLMSLEGLAASSRFGDGEDIVQDRQDFEEDAEKEMKSMLMRARKRAELSVQKREAASLTVKETDSEVIIGDVRAAKRSPRHPELVPDVVFVDMPEHVAALRDMLLDWTLGHHLLLIGNQGVGKNKLADRMLGLLQCEREYVQLHRDTTVQSLTLSQALEGGVVVSQESALVRAARCGRCLVVDEADKAPLEVVCVLKALADDGELALGDGRRLVRRGAGGGVGGEAVEIHEDFRLVVLANRPGFPFHGNDFYKVCGDVFSCHAVSNPDLDSELMLLRSVGGKVPKDQLAKLALLFRELRSMADSGQLAYPYSTRELVKVTQHLQRFRQDLAEQALANVFAFDLDDRSKRQQLMGILQKHGFADNSQTFAALRGREAFHRASFGEIAAEEGKGDKGKGGGGKQVPQPAANQGPGGRQAGAPTSGGKPGGGAGGRGEGKGGGGKGGSTPGGKGGKGGSGGAGAGGLGGSGAVRLDVGQAIKDDGKAPNPLTEAEQEMAREAYASRLRELAGQVPQLELYQQLREAVRLQVAEMRVVLESHEARERERIWLRQQTHGELDDARLVDGITGARAIYMRRGEPDPGGFQGEQKLPKRMSFMLDISGSMYAFNRIDKRLDRLKELVVFLLEAFEGMERRYDIRMVGHSGAGAEAEKLVDWGKAPRTPAERLEILERITAHSQFCSPGDSSVAAVQAAIKEVVREPADEYFVFLVSDADLGRYGITGDRVSKELMKDKRVRAYMVLISNKAGEADDIMRAVAPGRAHVCADNASLSTTFKTIFLHAMRIADDVEKG